MSEKNQNQQANFSIQRLYIKDLSFESPRAPELFRKQLKPQINMNVDTKHQSLGENLYEVSLELTVTAKTDDEVAFMIELHQAGIFAIDNLSDEQLQHTLNAFCPNLLFPYAREAIDNMTTRGSLPPLMLAPINFDAIYAQSQQKRKNQESVN